MNKPTQEKNLRARQLTGPFLTPVQTKIMSVQKYDLECTYNEPDDKTYYSTMYVRPAKTQVSIDSLYISKLLGYPGVRRRCILYDQRRVWSECDVAVTLLIPL